MIELLYEYSENGPGKVVKNLKSGLNSIGEKYSENSINIDVNKKIIALQWHKNISEYGGENLVIGPNICTIPTDNDFVMNGNYKKLIVPSQWVADLYSKWIPSDKIFIWPVGIDTNFFYDRSKKEKEFDCLVYFKRRSIDDLIFVENMLTQKNQKFNTITYGNYKESEFLILLSKSKYVIVIDNCESQGIAIEEIMSCNLPLFVWDITKWSDRGDGCMCDATSIPYWSDTCGSVETNKDKIYESFDLFLEKLAFFHPRDYILENLMLEKQAKEIINLFNN
jgi:hypothetical protein